jgi:aspartate racemase
MIKHFLGKGGILMKTLGIIGGVGPASTAEFYLKISYDCQKRNHVSRPNIVIGSVPAPYKVEREMILQNVNNYTPLLLAEAKRLQNADADFLVMPCNTLHCDIEAIRGATTIPVISIVDTSIAYIRDEKYKKVGLLATAATVKRNIYSDVFEENNIEFILPSVHEQSILNELIVNLVDGRCLENNRQFVHGVIDRLKSQGADCIALACTELQLLKPEEDRDDLPIFDTMSILAEATVDEILKE